MNFSDYKIVNLDIIDLYHITPKNIEANYEEREYLKTWPKDKFFDFQLDKPMYFGLTENFTLYYDDKGYGKYMSSKFRSVHLKFTTNKRIKIMIIENKRNVDINKIELYITENNLDGFLAQDDPDVGWFEICLIKPINVINLSPQILNHDCMNKYKYTKKDVLSEITILENKRII